MGYSCNRLPFGVSPGTFLFSSISEPLFDLTNELLEDNSWNPHTLNNESIQPYLKPMTEIKQHSDPVVPRTLIPKLKFRTASADGFIDDVMSFGLASKYNQLQNAAALVSHAVFRPQDPLDKVVRDNPSSLRKIAREGKPENNKIILGWELDLHAFLIKLETLKTKCWVKELN